jgi:uncharacterized protein involved in outer membrane biogenesis
MLRNKFFIGITLAILALIIGGVIAVSRIDPKEYVGLVEAKIEEATGRELKIDGKVGYSLSLRPTVVAEGIRFRNAPWGSRKEMLTARQVEIQVALLPLLRGSVDVVGVVITEPDLLLETNAAGEKNWEFRSARETPKPAASEGTPITIGRARIENGLITYRVAKAKSETRLKLDNLTLTSGGDRVTLKGSTKLNDVPVELNAAIDSAQHVGSKGAAGKSEITVSANGLKIALAGMLPLGPDAITKTDVKFNAEISDWSTLGRLTGTEPRKLPALRTEGAAVVKGTFLVAENVKTTLGKSVFNGSLRMPIDEKREPLELNVDSPLVDLAELLGKSAPAKPSPDGRIFSAEPIATDGLKALHAKVSAKVNKLALRDGRVVDGVQANITATNGKISAEPVRISIEGRELRIRANADATSGKSLALNLSIEGQGISLGALGAMFDLSGTPEGSPTDIAIRFAGTGASMRALMASANADVRIVIGPGRIKNRAIEFGADVTELLNVLNPTRASDPHTDLKCAVIRLPIRQGVARIENSIAAETSKVNFIAAGIIDLRNETLDLGFRTKAATGLGIGVGSLAKLARLRGTLANPSVAMDAAGTATAAAKLGLAVATGGLSLLAGGLLTDDVPDQACNAALTGITRTKQSTASEKSPVRSLVDGIKNLFR